MKKNNNESFNPDLVPDDKQLNQQKQVLISSQEDLVNILKDIYNGTSSLIMIGDWPKYLVLGNNHICAIKLFDMLLDGVIADNAIKNLDDILQYSDIIFDRDDLYKFLTWFYKSKILSVANILDTQELQWEFSDWRWIKIYQGLPNAYKSFDIKSIKSLGTKTKFIFDLKNQKRLGLCFKDNYSDESPLENFLSPKCITDIDDLKGWIPKDKKIPWQKLEPALNNYSVTNFETLTQITDFDSNSKISYLYIGPNSVSNYKSLFDLCDNDAKMNFFGSLLYPDISIFKAGSLKEFPLNDPQTLKEYGLIKKTRLMYPLYVLCDIGRIIIWLFTLGKKCNDDFFCTTRKLYHDNDMIDQIIDKIREDQNAKLEEPDIRHTIDNSIPIYLKKNDLQNNSVPENLETDQYKNGEIK